MKTQIFAGMIPAGRKTAPAAAETNADMSRTPVNGTVTRFRNTEYTGNMSTEKLIIQKLIEGPENGEDVYPTLSKDTSLLSVSTKNGVCYVNFNAAIREKPYNATENVVIYSIVNSLTELPNIDQVQILVEGVSDGTLYDSMSLDRLYERDTDIVQ